MSTSQQGGGSAYPEPRRRRANPVALWLVLIVALFAATWASWFVIGRAIDSRSRVPSTLVSGSASDFNVVVVTLEATRADRLGCYGREQAETPFLDILAREGLMISDAVTVAPVSLPAHASIFTGLYPPHHGVRRNDEHRLAPDHVTLAELLRDRGYETAAFVGAFTLDARFGLDQGFDLYDGVINPPTLTSLSVTPDERKAAQVTDAALDWLDSRDTERPFLAWIHYVDPRQPFDPPEPYRSRFQQDGYGGELAYIDSQVGRLVGALRKRDLAYETLLLVVGDHGEGLGEHGESAHDFFIYDSVMKVPMILWAPGLFNGPYVIDDTVVSVVDLFPTALDLLGISERPVVDGKTLTDDGPDPERAVYMESLAPYVDFGWSPLFGLRRHDDKFIRAPRPEYFDLVADPDERTNLAPGRLDAVLRDKLEGMISDTVDPATGTNLADPKDMLDVVHRFESARALVMRGMLREGLAELEEIAGATPGNRAALAEMARVYWMMGSLPQAERTLRGAIELGPTAETLTTLAEVLVAYQRFDEVEDPARRALALDPHMGRAYLVLGDLAKEQARYDEAAAFYEKAREVDPHRLGLAYERRVAALERHLNALKAVSR